jgi:hypothetical protein
MILGSGLTSPGRKETTASIKTIEIISIVEWLYNRE